MLRILGLVLGFFVAGFGAIGVFRDHDAGGWPFLIAGAALFVFSMLRKGPAA